MSSQTATSSANQTPVTRAQRRTLLAAGSGTFIEFFDYASYAYLAVTLSTVFFPPGEPGVAVIQTLAVLALSFLMRPLGGLFWGHFGDRIGRRRVLAITIIGMGVATVIVGLLPGYAAIGLFAPALLLLARLVQSFSAAGEYSGAAVLIAECAPEGRRARWVSVVPIGSAAGFLFASFLATILYGLLDGPAMESWGWRLPFLMSLPLTAVGLYIRSKLEESPAFVAMESTGQVSKSPLAASIKGHAKPMLRMFCIMGVNAGGYYLVLSYMATYLEQVVQLDPFHASIIVTIALVVYLPLLYLFAGLADKYGRKRILILNCVLFFVLSYPAFVVLEHVEFAGALAIQILLVAIFSMNDSTFATYFIESFPPNVRFSGFALPFNFGVALFGGLTPLSAAWLIQMTGSGIVPAFIIMVISLVALAALARSKEPTFERN